MQSVEFPWIEEQNLCHLRTVSSLALQPPSTRKSSPKYFTTTWSSENHKFLKSLSLIFTFLQLIEMTRDRRTSDFMIGTLTDDDELPWWSSLFSWPLMTDSTSVKTQSFVPSPDCCMQHSQETTVITCTSSVSLTQSSQHDNTDHVLQYLSDNDLSHYDGTECMKEW